MQRGSRRRPAVVRPSSRRSWSGALVLDPGRAYTPDSYSRRDPTDSGASASRFPRRRSQQPRCRLTVPAFQRIVDADQLACGTAATVGGKRRGRPAGFRAHRVRARRKRWPGPDRPLGGAPSDGARGRSSSLAHSGDERHPRTGRFPPQAGLRERRSLRAPPALIQARATNAGPCHSNITALATTINRTLPDGRGRKGKKCPRIDVAAVPFSLAGRGGIECRADPIVPLHDPDLEDIHWPAPSTRVLERTSASTCRLPPPRRANYVALRADPETNSSFPGRFPSEGRRDRSTRGQLGDRISVEDGQAGAQLCAINLIAQMRAALDGDLDRVRRGVLRAGEGSSICRPRFSAAPDCGHRRVRPVVERASPEPAGHAVSVGSAVAGLPFGVAGGGRGDSPRFDPDVPVAALAARRMGGAISVPAGGDPGRRQVPIDLHEAAPCPDGEPRRSGSFREIPACGDHRGEWDALAPRRRQPCASTPSRAGGVGLPGHPSEEAYECAPPGVPLDNWLLQAGALIRPCPRRPLRQGTQLRRIVLRPRIGRHAFRARGRDDYPKSRGRCRSPGA